MRIRKNLFKKKICGKYLKKNLMANRRRPKVMLYSLNFNIVISFRYIEIIFFIYFHSQFLSACVVLLKVKWFFLKCANINKNRNFDPIINNSSSQKTQTDILKFLLESFRQSKTFPWNVSNLFTRLWLDIFTKDNPSF